MSEWGFFTWFWKIVSWSWILLGLWWFLRPEGIKKRMRGKFRKTLGRIFFLALVVGAGALFSAAKDVGGVAGAILFVLGIVVLLKALIFLRSRARDAVFAWWADRPLWFYRVSAAALVACGVFLSYVTG